MTTIRPYSEADVNAILDIWLQASIKAHDFVAAEFWQSQVDNMRDIYIPASTTLVSDSDSDSGSGSDLSSSVIGFYSLYESTLAAIFVSSEWQGQGIGKQLMAHAKSQNSANPSNPALTLSVYKENEASVKFYLSQGFTILSEQADEHTGHQEYSMIATA
jgi:putative acetyltransferase